MADACHASCRLCASADRGPFYTLRRAVALRGAPPPHQRRGAEPSACAATVRARRSVSALVGGIVASDFSEDAFRDGVVRAAVVDAQLRRVTDSRVRGVAVRSASGDETAAAQPPPPPPGAPAQQQQQLPAVVVDYQLTLDSRRDADAYAAVALRATDDALAAAANERSNMRAARAVALLGPPLQPRPVPQVPPA